MHKILRCSNQQWGRSTPFVIGTSTMGDLTLTRLLIFSFSLLKAHCLLCHEILEMPEDHHLSLTELKTIPPKEIIKCLAHLGRAPLDPEEAEFIWDKIVKTYKCVQNIPERLFAVLHYVTVAVQPEDYANITFSSIDVVENFGLDYNLDIAQMSALAERVREDFAGKTPEDYTFYDLTALNYILCQFNRSEIERIHPSAFREAAVTLGKLYNCGSEALSGFATLAVQPVAFGPPSGWTKVTLDTLGNIANYLPDPSNLNDIYTLKQSRRR